MKVSQDSTGASCITQQQKEVHNNSSPPVLLKKRDGTFNRQETKIPVQMTKSMLQALDSCKALLRKRISKEETPVICVNKKLFEPIVSFL